MRRLLALTLIAVAGCTPAQEAAWMRWFHQDPQAATAWAVDECGDLCTLDWDHDGIVEPESDGRGVNREPPVPGVPPDASTPTIPEPGQAPSSLGGACSQWADTALDAGWSAEDWPTVSRIMWAESGCNPDAYNPQEHFGGNASGLMQIIWPTWAAECGDGDIFDPYFNLSCALYLKTTYGWSQWSTY